MSNFIDEAERHTELYGTYTPRQQYILVLVKNVTRDYHNDENVRSSLLKHGVANSEIHWLMRNGHYLPIYN